MKLVFLFLMIFSSQAALIDKVVAVFNDKVITKSEIDRAFTNYSSRRVVSPVVYQNQKYTWEELVDVEININTIRAYLTSNNYNVTDDQVEKTIESFLSQRRSNKKELVTTLNQQGITFDEYFELIRASREFNILMNVAVEPLISITEQQIKNEFFRRNADNNTLAVQYYLVMYQISKEQFKSVSGDRLIEGLKKYRNTGIMPKELAMVDEINMGEVSEDDLVRNVSTLLKKTDEGEFSQPVELGGNYVTYFIRKKDLVEAEFFKKRKNQIRALIYEKEAKKVLSIWLSREREKHYIKKY